MNTLIFANETIQKTKERFKWNFECFCKNKNAVIRQSYAACSNAPVIGTDFHTFAIHHLCCQYQHNYVNNIKMIKGVHQLTLRTNILISLIDHFTIFNGWMNSQAYPSAELGFFFFFFFLGGGGSGPTARIQDPHMGPIQYVRTHARTHTYRQAHEYSCTGRRIDIHVHV